MLVRTSANQAHYFFSLGASTVYGFEPDPESFRIAQQDVKLNNMTHKVEIFNRKVTVESLRSLILQTGCENIFMKTDCEGCEYELFENIDDKIFERVNDVVIESRKEAAPLVSRLKALKFKVRRKKGQLYASKKQ